MSPLLYPVFTFMLCTFLLGLSLGWLLWKLGGGAKALRSEVDFWRSQHEQSRHELWTEQTALSTAREELDSVKKKLAAQRK